MDQIEAPVTPPRTTGNARLPPNVTQRRRRRVELTPEQEAEDRAQTDAFFARVMGYRRTPTPRLVIEPDEQLEEGEIPPPANVTQRRRRIPMPGRIPRLVIEPDEQPRGVAFEIHNAFENFQSIKNDYLDIISQPNEDYGDIYNYINEKYSSIIIQLFPNQEEETEKIRQLQKLLTKIMNSRFDEYKDLIGKTVSFVSKQDDNFKKEYIIAFLNDSCNAYSGGRDNTSCVKGIIERIVLSVGTTVQVLCMDHCDNETYQKLNALMNPRFKVDDAANNWFQLAETNQEIQAMDKAARKQNFIDYLKAEAIRLDYQGGVIPQNVMDKINTYAETLDYAFADLQLGGIKQPLKKVVPKYQPLRKSRKQPLRKVVPKYQSLRKSRKQPLRKVVPKYQSLRKTRKQRSRKSRKQPSRKSRKQPLRKVVPKYQPSRKVT
jgi:hypothetical protein